MTRPRLYQVDFDVETYTTGTHTLDASDGVALADTTGGSITFNLPECSTVPDRAYYVLKIAAANTVTLDPNGAQTIDGAATYTLSDEDEWAMIVCDGVSWNVLSGSPASLALDDLTDVNTGGVNTGDVIYFNGAAWVDTAPMLAGFLQDVSISGVAAKDILMWVTGVPGSWQNRPLSDINLDDLGDVAITTPQDGAALVWDDVAGEWIDSTHIRDDGDIVELGDPTDHIEISAEGEVTLVGTSRVLREIRIEAGRARIGASAPIQTTRVVGASGNVRVPVDQFSKTTQNDTYFEIHAPSDMDGTEPVYFHLMWFPGASWTAGNYMWKLEYIVTDETGVELNAEAPTTISADVTPTAATNVIETEFTDSITFTNEQLLWCHFFRDVANDNGDDTGDVRWFEVEYVMNKFGEKYTLDADALLLESGDHLLLESGDRLLLEV